MFTKTLLVAAGAAGYVLGAKAGRERYDQIAGLADTVKGKVSGSTGPDPATAPTAAPEHA